MATENDPHDLERFLEAQKSAYGNALDEIRAGRKRSHWIWFIFPQFEGLGYSSASKRYAIRSLGEARAYLAHPVLGARLRECFAAMLEHAAAGGPARSAREVLGWPDDLKFRSSATLFALAAPGEPLFREALEKFFEGAPDPGTLELAGGASSG